MPLYAKDDILQILEEVRAGTSPKESIEQSTCLAIRNGLIHTFNEEVFCRKKTSFPQEWEFAVTLAPVVQVLTKLNDPEIHIDFNGKELVISGKGRKTGFTIQKDIALPIDQMNLPTKEDWNKLPEDFTDAIAIVESCAGRSKDEFVSTCLHIHPKYIEATDRFQAARYKMAMDIESPILLRRESIEPAVGLELTKYAQTKNWFHLRSSTGLLYSVKENRDVYPDLSPILALDGVKTTLPKSLAAAAGIAEIFSSEDKDNNTAMITLEPGRITIRGEGTAGWHQERKKIKYDGKPMTFMMSPKIIAQVIDRNNEVYLANNRLIIDGGNWTYATVLAKKKKVVVDE